MGDSISRKIALRQITISRRVAIRAILTIRAMQHTADASNKKAEDRATLSEQEMVFVRAVADIDERTVRELVDELEQKIAR